jgi:transposase InsO family protein
VRNSAGRPGICYDNAASESFWATLKKELVHVRAWESLARVKHAVFEYIEGYYNIRRLHSTLGYVTPSEHEELFWKVAKAV